MSNDKAADGIEDGVGSPDDLLDLVAVNPELARLAFLLAGAPSQRELSGLEGALDTFRARVPAGHTRPRW